MYKSINCNTYLKTQRKRPHLAAKILALVVFLLLAAVSYATSCDTADYRHLVGSMYTRSRMLNVAPNSRGDLLIAGIYLEMTDVDYPEYAYVYLFRESTCSYMWRFGN